MNCETNTSDFATANANPETPETRQANGRFAKGNRGGPGNPFARQTAQLRQAMLNAISPEDMRITIEALKKKAATGDVPAIKLLLSYSVGKPVAPVNPDTLDQDELQTIIGNHLESAEGPLNVLKGMPLDVLVEMFSLILPVLRSEKVKMAKKVLCAPLTEEEIEANKDDDDDDVPDNGAAAAPAEDPMENIPQWMQDIGKETEQTATLSTQRKQVSAGAEKGRKGARAKRGRAVPSKPVQPGSTPQVSEAEVDAELLRVLLERARDLSAVMPPSTNGKPTAHGQPEAAPPAPTAQLPEKDEPASPSHGKVKMANGPRPPSRNGVNGKK